MTNPLSYAMTQQYAGVDIIETPHAISTTQDWSGCRSPSRARRRHAKGIKTRMVETRKPSAFMFGGRLYAHPAYVAELRKMAADQMNRLVEGNLYKPVRGPVVPDDTIKDVMRWWRPGGLLGIKTDIGS